MAVGAGWQWLVAYINIGCYYLFGLPLGFLLGNKFNLGVEVSSKAVVCFINLSFPDNKRIKAMELKCVGINNKQESPNNP